MHRRSQVQCLGQSV